MAGDEGYYFAFRETGVRGVAGYETSGVGFVTIDVPSALSDLVRLD